MAQELSLEPSPQKNGADDGLSQKAIESFRIQLAERVAATPTKEQVELNLTEAEVAELEQNFFPDLPGADPIRAPRLVQGIIFDFDDTLAHLNRPLPELMAEGAKAAQAYMQSTGMDLHESFWEQIIDARLFADQKSAEEQEEHIANDTMSFLLQFFGYPASRMDPNVLKTAVDLFYAPEMGAWKAAPGAHAMLAALQKEGYKLALVANHPCERVFQRMVDYTGLRPYLDLVVCSAGVEWRKPVPDIFQIALDRWQALAYEVVVVGDSLAEDIAAGLELGALTVQVQNDSPQAAALAENSTPVIPDAVVTDLTQLPGLIQAWAV